VAGDRRRQADIVLDLIDGALRDCGLSGDAMRWSPDPDAAPALPDRRPVLTWLAGLTREMRRVLRPAPDPPLLVHEMGAGRGR
jgi:hypothetical protein